jgi:REP element-mobilizing transposase RayT
MARVGLVSGVWQMGDAFNTGEPLAYLLTWTTYGTWLPGDERGWSRKGIPDPQGPNRMIAEIARSRTRERPFYLSADDRRVVETTIREHCEIRQWALHAVNARSNHVHVVVTAPGRRPEVVRDQFKAWCTRKLKKVDARRTRFWTEGGSCRWINTDDDLETAVVYVVEAQDRKGADEG